MTSTNWNRIGVPQEGLTTLDPFPRFSGYSKIPRVIRARSEDRGKPRSRFVEKSLGRCICAYFVAHDDCDVRFIALCYSLTIFSEWVLDESPFEIIMMVIFVSRLCEVSSRATFIFPIPPFPPDPLAGLTHCRYMDFYLSSCFPTRGRIIPPIVLSAATTSRPAPHPARRILA